MSASGPLVVVGDALLDRDVEGTVERLSPDALVPVLDQERVRSRPGGAGLAALLLAQEGRSVMLISALGRDAAACELEALLCDHGVEVVDLGLDGATPEKVRMRAGGRTLLRLDRGGSQARVGPASAAARAAIGTAGAILVSDYGRGMAAQPAVRALLACASLETPVVWDPHPHGPAPTPGVRLATPNLAEARALEPAPPGDDICAVGALARALVARWSAHHVCITCGARGAVLAGSDGAPRAVPAEAVPRADPCGAGDRFATAALTALAQGAGVAEAVTRAVAAASRFVAAGGASALPSTPRDEGKAASGGQAEPASGDEREPATGGEGRPATGRAAAHDVARRVRAAGGTVVATGGCFDLLHPGHVRTLEAARALGDCLVVCLNSDASVRRLKGPGRPLVGEEDRAALLRALRCVDAVLVFAEDTPVAALEQLRPHVWAKGGDYDGHELPEAAVLARWGGRAVVLPFLDGRSTSRLIEEARVRVVG